MSYNLDAPYVTTINGAQLVYPVLKGTAAYGGEVSPGTTKHLLLEFNCMGIEGVSDLRLTFDSAFFAPVTMDIRKTCSSTSSFEIIEQDLEENLFFDLLFLIFV